METRIRFILQGARCTLAVMLLFGKFTATVNGQIRYVYPGRQAAGRVDGTAAYPYPTLAIAADAAPAGSTLVLQGYQYTNEFTITYPETGSLPLIINKNLRLTTLNGAARIGPPLGTQRLWQLTGEIDREWGTNTPGRTETRFGLRGTDLGSSFEYGDRIYFLFGDTFPSFSPGDDRPLNTDSVAWIPTNSNPEQPLSLNFITAPDGKYLPPSVIRPDGKFIPLGTCEVPISGFSANGQMYAFFATDTFSANGSDCHMGHSVLARLNDLGTIRFDYLYDVSCRPEICGDAFAEEGKFINIAPVIVKDPEFHELIQEINKGEGVLLWGSGLYHRSDPYLAFVPLNGIENPNTWRYAVTDCAGTLMGWSGNESDATCLFDQPWFPDTEGGIGELSVASIPYVDGHGNKTNKWLMTYNHLKPPGINYRVADKPWGPWEGPYVLFDPWLDHGICYFMHADAADPCDSVDDGIQDAPRSGTPYGPYVISRFTKSDATTATIYWTMSTWHPYQVMLMKSTIRLSDWLRVDHLQKP